MFTLTRLYAALLPNINGTFYLLLSLYLYFYVYLDFQADINQEYWSAIMHAIWFSMIRLKVDQKTDFFYQQID